MDMSTGAVHSYTSNSHGLFTAPFLPPDAFDAIRHCALHAIDHYICADPEWTAICSDTYCLAICEYDYRKVSALNALLIDTQTSNTTTTFTTSQFQNLPAPGGDITTIAFHRARSSRRVPALKALAKLFPTVCPGSQTW